ncbi:MAG: thioredoxin domain-containing protein [Patescibacteria group bacterium]
MTKDRKVNNTSLIVVGLLIVVAFLIGNISGREKGGEVVGEQSKDVAGAVAFAPTQSDKPTLEFYVMSFCPFGNQAETGLKPVAELLGDKVDWQPRYIIDKQSKPQLEEICQSRIYDQATCQGYVDQGYFPNLEACKQRFYTTATECFEKTTADCLATEDGNYYCSLHGKKELNQNVREICAWNQTEDKNQWWQFVDLVNNGCQLETVDQCWQAKADEAKLDKDKIQECFNTQAIELLDKEVAATQKAQVSGSPSVFINGVNYPGDEAYASETAQLKIGDQLFAQAAYRTPETYKQAVCAAFEKQPKECKTELASEVTAGDPGSCD